MLHRRVAVLIVLASALLAGLLPATIAGAAGGYATKVVVSLKFPAYHGALRSAKPACRKQRTVRLFRRRDGRVRLLGSDRSNRRGRWSVPVKNLTSGEYWAKATARGSCRAGRSRVLTID